jgi:hypothetical protein
VLFVGTELKEKMEAAHFSGLEFWPVFKRKGDLIPDIHQMYVTNTLPALLPKESYESLFVENEPIRICPTCGCPRAFRIRDKFILKKYCPT